jgi:hypothetical protein
MVTFWLWPGGIGMNSLGYSTHGELMVESAVHAVRRNSAEPPPPLW